MDSDRCHGFAARCEAVAMPRQTARITLGLCPWFGLSPSGEAIILPIIIRSSLTDRHVISPLTGLYAQLSGEGQSPSVTRVVRRGIATASHRAAKPCRCLRDLCEC